MNLAQAIEVMIESGCTKDQISAMSRAYGREDEERKNAARTLARVRQQRRRRVGLIAICEGSNVIDFVQPVTVVTRDVRDAAGVLPEVSLNNNNKTLPNPSPKDSSPTPSKAKPKVQAHLFDPEPLRLFGERWNLIAAENPGLTEIEEIEPRSRVEKHAKLTLKKIIRDGMDAPTAIKSYFDRISASDWLMGRKGSFIADFAWIADPDHCSNILGGRYENRQGGQAKSGFGGYGAYNGRELSQSGKRVSEAWRGPIRD